LDKIKGGKVMRKNTESIKPKDLKAVALMKKDFAEKPDPEPGMDSPYPCLPPLPKIFR